MTKIFALTLIVWSLCFAAQSARSEWVSLRQRSRTLIEAENFAAASPEFPNTEHCKICSSGQNLGYFWKDSWFEVDVLVAKDATFSITLRTASPEGSNVELLGNKSDSGKLQPLGVFEIPQTCLLYTSDAADD